MPQRPLAAADKQSVCQLRRAGFPWNSLQCRSTATAARRNPEAVTPKPPCGVPVRHGACSGCLASPRRSVPSTSPRDRSAPPGRSGKTTRRPRLRVPRRRGHQGRVRDNLGPSSFFGLKEPNTIRPLPRPAARPGVYNALGLTFSWGRVPHRGMTVPLKVPRSRARFPVHGIIELSSHDLLRVRHVVWLRSGKRTATPPPLSWGGATRPRVMTVRSAPSRVWVALWRPV